MHEPEICKTQGPDQCCSEVLGLPEASPPPNPVSFSTSEMRSLAHDWVVRRCMGECHPGHEGRAEWEKREIPHSDYP